MVLCWLADAKSVEFLDLCCYEFRKNHNATLISALDLYESPRRYSSIYDYGNREQIIRSLRVRHQETNFFPCVLRSGPAIPSRKLIEVFRTNVQTNRPFSLFSVCASSMLEKLLTKWKSERFRRVLNYLKAYRQHAEKSLFPVICVDYDPHLMAFDKPSVVYDAMIKRHFIESIQREAIPLLMTISFLNFCPDSNLFAEIFYAVFQRRCCPLDILFMCDAEVTEYVLHHMKKEKYNIKPILDTVQEVKLFNSLFRSNPEHLLVFLNNGIKIIFKSTRIIPFYQLYPSEKMEINRQRFPESLKREWLNLKPRETAILEILIQFSTWSVPNFAIYLEFLRLTWRSIPDAFLTYEEMKHFLLKYVDTTFVDDICNKLKEYKFDSFDVVLQPRSLMHYSRCAIRDSLRRNSLLPEGIGLLHLPPRLESFLKLEL